MNKTTSLKASQARVVAMREWGLWENKASSAQAVKSIIVFAIMYT